MYNWTNQPIALAPQNSTAYIFSGSAVIDVNNTSGFFPNQTNGVVAVYTIAGPVQQVQAIAYSYDDGYNFQIYEGNPVLQADSPHFRDPKVFWYQDHWVMVLAFAQEFTLGIYTSPNLKQWQFASNFSYHGLLGTQYECPNLVEMPMQGSDEPLWLMYFSIQPGAPLGGSIGEYVPGRFNGTHFTAVDAAARIADWGKDNYASQFFYNIPGTQNQVSVAWASNWQYTNYVPTGPLEGWQSVMSLPRVNYLKNATRVGYTLVSLPYGLDKLRSETAVASNPNIGFNGSLVTSVENDSGAFLIDVNITSLNFTGLAPSASINFTLVSGVSGESIEGGVFLATDATQWVDRGKIRGWDNPYYTNRFAAAFVLEDSFDFQIIVDRSIIEIFGLEGEKSATLLYYPLALLDRVTVNSTGLNQGAKVSVSVHSLDGGWPSAVVQPNGTAISQPSRNEAMRRSVIEDQSWKF